MSIAIKDQFGRPLRDLRISVTDRCNFRCQYCMPEEFFGKDYPFLVKKELLTPEELVRLVSIFVSLGVRKLRITGGEPFLRSDLPLLLSMFQSLEEIEDISVTTNGLLLKNFASQLKGTGIKRLNVSLDTLNDDLFKQLTSRKHKVKDILAGIEAVASVGIQVKINMVVLKGVNDQEIVPMARYFRGTGHILRFIEFMDVGNYHDWNTERVISKQAIFDLINEQMPLEQLEPDYYGEVASRYRYKGTSEEIGIISSITDSFCHSCTRARLSADGQLYTCLFATEGYDLRKLLRSQVTDRQLKKEIISIWNSRTDRYSEERFIQTNKKKHKKIEMSYIGG